MSRTLAKILPLCLAAALLFTAIFGALLAYHEKCALLAELSDIQNKVPLHPSESTAQAAPQSRTQLDDMGLPSLDSLKENAKLLEDLMNEEELNRLLDHAQRCYDTYRALQQTNLGGGGMCVASIHDAKDVENYWKNYDFDRKRVQDDFQKFTELMATLDLSRFSLEERKKLDTYMELRERWSKILYDFDADMDEKVSVGRQMWEILYTKSRLGMQISQLAEESLGDQFRAYKEMHYKYYRLFLDSSYSLPIRQRTYFQTINNRNYRIILPDSLAFLDDVSLDDE